MPNLFPIDDRGRTFSYIQHRTVKLTAAMQRLVKALNQHGDIDTIRDGGTVGTVVALMERGILREATPRSHGRGSGHHYPATTPEQMWDEAHAMHPGQWTNWLSDEGRQVMRDAAHVDAISALAPGYSVPSGYSDLPWRLETDEEAFNNDAAELLEEQSPHPAPLTVERDCTHGDGCPVHPDTRAVHNFDSDETPEQWEARHALDRPLIEAFNTITAERADAHSSAYWEAATEGLPREPAFSAPAPTPADDVAALREKIGEYGGKIQDWRDEKREGESERGSMERFGVAKAWADLVEHLDRIAGAVPQRATNRLGQPMSVHRPDRCGFVFAGDGWPSCSCGTPGGWQALYTLGGES